MNIIGCFRLEGMDRAMRLDKFLKVSRIIILDVQETVKKDDAKELFRYV